MNKLFRCLSLVLTIICNQIFTSDNNTNSSPNRESVLFLKNDHVNVNEWRQRLTLLASQIEILDARVINDFTRNGAILRYPDRVEFRFGIEFSVPSNNTNALAALLLGNR
jgi:hypothetical protein